MAGERTQWGRQLEFVLTLIGYAVGLGNVWRFPYLCYRNGGGAFLIPYTISLICMGIPLFALEVSFGQFAGQGPMTVWNINPAAKGLGMCVLTVSFIVMIYYGVVIAWALRFLIASFTSHLPWNDCTSCDCLLYQLNTTDLDVGQYMQNNSLGLNCSNVAMSPHPLSPSEVYFTNRILGRTKSIDETGDLQWELLLTNLLANVIVFLVLVKGISSLGKVAYFTAIFPYVLLTILLVRGTLLEGASEGVKFYLTPDWSRLSDANVWSDAAVQIFFSLGACSGGLIAMSSYNNFNNNAIRDSFLVPIINCLTSFFAGFVVFSTLGYMAHVKGTDVASVTAGGPGLAFVVYPEAISQMPVSPLWAILFFFMVSILGFSTQFSAAETVMTSIIDQFPHTFNTTFRTTAMRASILLASFLLGIPMVLGSGQYLLDLIDQAELGYPLLLVGLIELIIIIGLYGYDNFAEDIRCMIGRYPPVYLKICWRFISPIILTGVIVFKVYQHTPQEVEWANLVYWMASLFPLSMIPGWWFYYTCTQSKLTTFTPEWRGRRELSNREQKPTTMVDVMDISLNEKGTGPSVTTAADFVNRSYLHNEEDVNVKM